MSEEERIEPQEKVKVRTTNPKTNQIDLERCKVDYVTSNWKSITELSSRYSINKYTLNQRIMREEWEKERLENLAKLRQKTEKKMVSCWIERVKERGEKDWSILDRSIDNLGSEVDPDTMLTSVKARKVIDDMVRRAYGLSDSVDVTSKGLSLGESWANAVQKLRETEKVQELTSQDCERILEAEVIDEDPK